MINFKYLKSYFKNCLKVKKSSSKYLVYEDNKVKHLDNAFPENEDKNNINNSTNQTNNNSNNISNFNNSEVLEESDKFLTIKKVLLIIFFIIFFVALMLLSKVFINKTNEFLNANRSVEKKEVNLIDKAKDEVKHFDKKLSNKEVELLDDNKNKNENIKSQYSIQELKDIIYISNEIKNIFISERNIYNDYLNSYVSSMSLSNCTRNNLNRVDDLKEKMNDFKCSDYNEELYSTLKRRLSNLDIFINSIYNNSQDLDSMIDVHNKYIKLENSLTDTQETEVKDILNRINLKYIIKDNGDININ